LNNIKTEKENKELAKKLIKNNLELPLSFHVKNLDAIKIKISHIKIKNMLQDLREENFPKDEEYLGHIELIRIDFGDTEVLKNIYFFLVKKILSIYQQIILKGLFFLHLFFK